MAICSGYVEVKKMPLAGNYEYPYYDVDFALTRLKEIYDAVRSEQTTRSVVADALNMAEKGGGFTYLIAAIEKYGLIQTGGGNITITDLGKLAMFGEPKEVEHAKSKAAANVELFSEIASQYGKNPQLDQVTVFLRQKANVDIAKARKISPRVYKIYKKVANYITSAKKLAPTPKGSDSMLLGIGRRDKPMEPSTKSELLKIEFGDVYIQLPSDVGSIEAIKLAKDALVFMEQRLLRKQKEKKEQKSTGVKTN